MIIKGEKNRPFNHDIQGHDIVYVPTVIVTARLDSTWNEWLPLACVDNIHLHDSRLLGFDFVLDNGR